LATPLGVDYRFRVLLGTRSSELVGFLAPGSRFGPFGPAPSGLSSSTIRLGATRTDVPSCGFVPLQGYSPESSARHLSMRAPLLGFRYRSAHPFQRSLLSPGFPRPRFRSAFRVSHPLRGLLLHWPREFISPRKRPSASPFREFPSQRAARAFRSCLAVMPLFRWLRSRDLVSRVLRRRSRPSLGRWGTCLWPASRPCSP